MLTITTQPNLSFTLNRSDANDLELKLNVTTVGRAWSLLGDVLFHFSANDSKAITTYAVTVEQYAFLEFLRTQKGWESCVGLSP